MTAEKDGCLPTVYNPSISVYTCSIFTASEARGVGHETALDECLTEMPSLVLRSHNSRAVGLDVNGLKAS